MAVYVVPLDQLPLRGNLYLIVHSRFTCHKNWKRKKLSFSRWKTGQTSAAAPWGAAPQRRGLWETPLSEPPGSYAEDGSVLHYLCSINSSSRYRLMKGRFTIRFLNTRKLVKRFIKLRIMTCLCTAYKYVIVLRTFSLLPHSLLPSFTFYLRILIKHRFAYKNLLLQMGITVSSLFWKLQNFRPGRICSLYLLVTAGDITELVKHGGLARVTLLRGASQHSVYLKFSP